GRDGGVEWVDARDNARARIASRVHERAWDRRARKPKLGVVLVDRKGDAQHLRRRIGGVAPRANAFEVDARARLDVPKQARHGTSRSLRNAAACLNAATLSSARPGRHA